MQLSLCVFTFFQLISAPFHKALLHALQYGELFGESRKFKFLFSRRKEESDSLDSNW